MMRPILSVPDRHVKMNFYPLFLNRFRLAATVMAAALFLAGCGIIYIPDVQQGNMIKAENIARIKKGMTPQQVRFVLGTPLIRDPFHKDRWDYHYSYRQGGSGDTEMQRATIFFKNGRVASVSKYIPAKKKPVEEAEEE